MDTITEITDKIKKIKGNVKKLKEENTTLREENEELKLQNSVCKVCDEGISCNALINQNQTEMVEGKRTERKYYEQEIQQLKEYQQDILRQLQEIKLQEPSTS